MIYLVDKSAWEQRRHSQDAEERLKALMTYGQGATCQIIMLEILYSARSGTEYRQLRQWQHLLPRLPTGEAELGQALEVQAQLADRGQHHRPLPALAIAATAHAHGATVLHYDHDFDLIAEITGQPVEWIMPAGTN